VGVASPGKNQSSFHLPFFLTLEVGVQNLLQYWIKKATYNRPLSQVDHGLISQYGASPWCNINTEKVSPTICHLF